MVRVLPSPRSFERLDDDVTPFAALAFDLAGADLPEELIKQKFGDLQGLPPRPSSVTSGNSGGRPAGAFWPSRARPAGLHLAFAPENAPQPAVSVVARQETSFLQVDLAPFQRDEAYSIRAGEVVTISYGAKQGLLNALSTLKQLLSRRRDAFVLPHVHIYDVPNTEVRSVSTTFAWYGGFSRAGFDSQLWDFKGSKAFIWI